jgi:hypothetical protein
MTPETRYILKAIVRIAKTVATLFQKIADGKGKEI